MRKIAPIACSFLVALFFIVSNGYCANSHKVKSKDTVQKTSRKHHHSVVGSKDAHRHKTVALKGSRALTAARGESGGKKTRMKAAKAGRRAAKPGQIETSDVATKEIDKEDDEYIEYRLGRGEDIGKVAQKFNVDEQEIIDLNHVGKKPLKQGSIVFVPKTQEPEEDAPLVLNDRLSKPWKSEDERGILVKVAKSFAGAPYQYGGDSVRGVDCSGFVRKMYAIFGVDLPRSAREQFVAGPRVDKGDLCTGDLVFFRTKRYAKYPTHVGIYLGNDTFIHASSTLSRGVKVDHLSDSYFTRTYTGAVRLKAPPQSERSDTHSDTQRTSDNS